MDFGLCCVRRQVEVLRLFGGAKEIHLLVMVVLLERAYGYEGGELVLVAGFENLVAGGKIGTDQTC